MEHEDWMIYSKWVKLKIKMIKKGKKGSLVMTYLTSLDSIHTPKQDDTQVLICFSSINSAMSVCNGDTRPGLSYSPVSSTLGTARLCYSHFRLQVWNRRSRDPGGRSSGEVGRPGDEGGMRRT